MDTNTETQLGVIQDLAHLLAEDSHKWNPIQKWTGFLICLVAGLALASGYDYFRVGFSLVAILFGILLLTPAAAGWLGRIIEPEMVVFRDSQRKPKIVISAKLGIMILDDNQQPVVILGSQNDTTMLALGEPGSQGKTALHLTVGPGSAMVGVGPDDRPRVELLATSKDRSANVMLLDPSRGLTAHLAYMSGNVLAGLTMNGVDGAPEAMFPDVEHVARYQYTIGHGLAGETPKGHEPA